MTSDTMTLRYVPAHAGMVSLGLVVLDDLADSTVRAVAAELRELRKARRIRVAQLMAATGDSRATVSRQLRGEKEIPLGDLIRMCAVLGVDLFVLLDRAEKRRLEGR